MKIHIPRRQEDLFLQSYTVLEPKSGKASPETSERKKPDLGGRNDEQWRNALRTAAPPRSPTPTDE